MSSLRKILQRISSKNTEKKGRTVRKELFGCLLKFNFPNSSLNENPFKAILYQNPFQLKNL